MKSFCDLLVDTFPMGIDYVKYNDAARKKYNQKKSEMSKLRLQLMDHKKTSSRSQEYPLVVLLSMEKF